MYTVYICICISHIFFCNLTNIHIIQGISRLVGYGVIMEPEVSNPTKFEIPLGARFGFYCGFPLNNNEKLPAGKQNSR